MGRRSLQLFVSLAAVGLLTCTAYWAIPRNATTVGFAFILLVLLISSTWGFIEGVLTSVTATLSFNFFFLPPIGTFTIADPQNLVAFFSFLSTSLIASRLSAKAKRRTLDAEERQQDIERLYSFSRAILLIESTESFPKQLLQKLAEIFELDAAVLYERSSGEFFRAGPADFEGLDDQLRDAAMQTTAYSDPERKRVIVAVRLGSQPIASLALQGVQMADSVLQGVANLVAIGLERARAQDLAHQVEAARQSEQLRTTLIDAMAHEFKTPLTSIKAATTSLLDTPDQPAPSRRELLKIADEEADHLRELIDDAVEMARLDMARIELEREAVDVNQLVGEVVASLHGEIDGRPVEIVAAPGNADVLVDHRLMRLAIKQVLDNALKYSLPPAPITIRIEAGDGTVAIQITDRGKGIPLAEQGRIFERFYRSSAVKGQVTGSGLGLSIAKSIVQAHNGEMTVSSRPGETTFRMTVPVQPAGVKA